jgi:hypothetical protein
MSPFFSSGRESPTVIFIHIPKTAGSTMTAVSESHFSSEERYITSGSPDNVEGKLDTFFTLSEEEKHRIKWLSGHMGFGLHEHLPQAAVYITLLRDPIDRLLSSFYFNKSIDFSPFYEEINSGRMGLQEYVQHFIDVETDNLQTRMVSGNWYKKGSGPCTPQMLELAKQNLRHYFMLVGVTERFDEFYFLLRYEMKWSWTWHINHNVTRRRPRSDSLSPELRRFLEKNTQYDRALYDYAATLFEQQLAAKDFRFRLGLALYKAGNGLYKLYWQLRRYSVRTWLRRQFDRP